MSTCKPFVSRRLAFAIVLVGAPAFVAITVAGPQSATMKPSRAASTTEAAANRAWPTAAIADPATLGFTKAGLDALDARMQKSVADGDTAGMTILLLRHGQVADFKSFGKATEAAPMALDSLFRIYSMSKPITGVAMMQLYERGKWKLDDPITKYVPELANLKELTWGADGKAVMGADGRPVLATPKGPATMRQLMSHTAGFGYGLSGDDPVNKAFREDRVLGSKDLDELIARVASIPLLYEPGTRWSYSVAVDIQGYIVQKLSGQKFGDYLKAHVTGPIGMTDTAFYVTPAQKPRFTDVHHWDKNQNALVVNPSRPDRGGFEDPTRLESGGGGLVASTHDYARFCQMMLNKGEIGGARLLKPETVKLMAENHIGGLHVNVDGTAAQAGAEAVAFGLDFAVYTDPKVADLPYGKGTFYWGGAAGTWFWIDPVNDLAFIGMIQNQGGNRPGAMRFRGDSAALVYAALAPSVTKSSQPAK
jgi:CubicO group peptidase (beta-lactamase class C family)